MEALLQYVWKHKMFPLKPLVTTDGLAVEVIDTGLPNRDAGPDFFNAKVRIGGTEWVGNVEIHERASLWRTHGHDRDRRYDNVVLHIVGEADADAYTSEGRRVAQVRLDVPPQVAEGYAALLHEDRYPPCRAVIPQLDRLTVHGWLSRLVAERMERKTADIGARVERCGGSWEEALFVTMARTFGFGVNGDAFERWAGGGWLQAAAHHRDDLFQIEALFFGQAGLLDPGSMPTRYREAAAGDGYFGKLKAEYEYLAHKFGLRAMDGGAWKFLRMRPQNFPYIRLSQLACLYHSRRSDLSRLAECATADDMRRLLRTEATPYWQEHYAFGAPSRRARKALSAASLDVVIINTALPVLFAYGRHRMDESLCSRSLDMLAQLKAENNHITRLWAECGLQAENAADSQALIQLKREYCDRKDCLRCRIGYEYLRKGNTQTTT